MKMKNKRLYGINFGTVSNRKEHPFALLHDDDYGTTCISKKHEDKFSSEVLVKRSILGSKPKSSRPGRVGIQKMKTRIDKEDYKVDVYLTNQRGE
jgi:hypothetical protein